MPQMTILKRLFNSASSTIKEALSHLKKLGYWSLISFDGRTRVIKSNLEDVNKKTVGGKQELLYKIVVFNINYSIANLRIKGCHANANRNGKKGNFFGSQQQAEFAFIQIIDQDQDQWKNHG